METFPAENNVISGNAKFLERTVVVEEDISKNSFRYGKRVILYTQDMQKYNGLKEFQQTARSKKLIHIIHLGENDFYHELNANNGKNMYYTKVKLSLPQGNYNVFLVAGDIVYKQIEDLNKRIPMVDLKVHVKEKDILTYTNEKEERRESYRYRINVNRYIGKVLVK